MQVIRQNLGLKLLALALAIVGWAYFRFAGNPVVAAAQFDQQLAVPISAVNLPVGYVARFADHEAVLTVETKRSGPAIKPEEIKAVLDLTNKGTGVYNVPIELVAPDVVVQSLSPASETLTIEKIEERSIPIALHYSGTQPGGIVVGNASIAPESATVRGATSLLGQVVAVRADVALPNAPKEVDVMLRPIAVDASGAEVAGLTVAPNLVRVRLAAIAGSTTAK